jgi:hypothetical protein
MTTTRGKRITASTLERFKVQRDRGSDWNVMDCAKNIPVATGLDFDEAQTLADVRNKKRWRKKLA